MKSGFLSLTPLIFHRYRSISIQVAHPTSTIFCCCHSWLLLTFFPPFTSPFFLRERLLALFLYLSVFACALDSNKFYFSSAREAKLGGLLVAWWTGWKFSMTGKIYWLTFSISALLHFFILCFLLSLFSAPHVRWKQIGIDNGTPSEELPKWKKLKLWVIVILLYIGRDCNIWHSIVCDSKKRH